MRSLKIGVASFIFAILLTTLYTHTLKGASNGNETLLKDVNSTLEQNSSYRADTDGYEIIDLTKEEQI